MGNFDNIIQEINTNIPDNNEQLITAEKIRSTLIDFVNEVDSNEDGIETSLQGKTDKVINATNGNFASLDEDGNLVDSGLNSDNFVQKSETVGLLKNDGTVDTSTYLTQEDISGKADKTPIETSLPLSGGILPNVVYMLGTLANDASILISLATPTDNTIANVYTVTFDTSGFEDHGPSIIWVLPHTIYWADGDAPSIEPVTCYEISIMNNIAVCVMTEKTHILPIIEP